ncbi:MAG: hypothetical protein QMC40_03350, partial [Vicingaceae bacterium]
VLSGANTVTTENAKAELSVFARSGVESKFTVTVNGQSFDTEVGSTNLNRYEFRFAQSARDNFEFTPNRGLLSFNVDYDKPQVVSKGWLNYLTVNTRSKLIMSGQQMRFRDMRSVVSNGNGTEESVFEFPVVPNLRVWDITNSNSIDAMSLQSFGNKTAFQNNVTELR